MAIVDHLERQVYGWRPIEVRVRWPSEAAAAAASAATAAAHAASAAAADAATAAAVAAQRRRFLDWWNRWQ